VAITAVHTTLVDRTDHRRQRTLSTPASLFEAFEQLGQLPPVETLQDLHIKAARIEQLLDPEHHHTHLDSPIMSSSIGGSRHQTP
jgi:hypothetical protein